MTITSAPPQCSEPPPPLAADLCWLLSRASHVLMTEFTAALQASGISPRQHAVLATALDADHTQTDLARLVGLDKTTMMVTVDELEAAGLARRRPLETDRRARVIAVTDAGRVKLGQAETVLERVRDDVLSVLPGDERTIFLRSLGRLAGGRLSEPVVCSHPVRRRG